MAAKEWFKRVSPTMEQQELCSTIEDKYSELVDFIVAEIPRNADRSAVIRKLREAKMTTVGAVLYDGVTDQ